MGPQRRLRRLGAHLGSSSSSSSSAPALHGVVGLGQPRGRVVVNCAEHAFLTHDDARYHEFPFRTDKSYHTGLRGTPQNSMEHLLADMRTYSVDKLVISHVVYYGDDNSYTAHCIKAHPQKFTGVGLLVGDGMLDAADPSVPGILEKLVVEDGLSGLRLSPIYNQQQAWLNSPGSYPLWAKAQELGAVLHIYCVCAQLSQVADMAARFPGVKLVIDHFAEPDISRPASEGIDLLCALAVHPNIFIRTSLHNPSLEPMPFRDMWPLLRQVYDAFGAKRMLYGNFYEYLIMADLIPFFSEEDKDWVLGKTALSIYKWQQE